MKETRILLDPTAELDPGRRARAPRPESLEGLTVGLLDISKAQSDIFLDQLETRLNSRDVQTRRYRKPTFARVAPTELMQQIVDECDLVVEALAD